MTAIFCFRRQNLWLLAMVRAGGQELVATVFCGSHQRIELGQAICLPVWLVPFRGEVVMKFDLSFETNWTRYREHVVRSAKSVAALNCCGRFARCVNVLIFARLPLKAIVQALGAVARMAQEKCLSAKGNNFPYLERFPHCFTSRQHVGRGFDLLLQNCLRAHSLANHNLRPCARGRDSRVGERVKCSGDGGEICIVFGGSSPLRGEQNTASETVPRCTHYVRRELLPWLVNVVAESKQAATVNRWQPTLL